VARVLFAFPDLSVSSTRQRSALSRVLAAPALRNIVMMQRDQPAHAGAVGAARALVSGFVQPWVSGIVNGRAVQRSRAIAGHLSRSAAPARRSLVAMSCSVA
jgi:hypothetical protein